MTSSQANRGEELTSQQEASRDEWRTLCQALERAQGEELNQNCRDKYQFAKSYLVFGRDVEAAIADVRQRAMHGKYGFFCDRGINAEAMTPPLAERMLRDWKHAIEAKREQTALVFHSKFGQSIHEYVDIASHEVDKAAKMAAAKSLFETDAILEMASLPTAPATEQASQFTVEDITAIVRSELEDITPLKTELARLRSDVERILAHLCLETDEPRSARE